MRRRGLISWKESVWELGMAKRSGNSKWFVRKNNILKAGFENDCWCGMWSRVWNVE